MRLPMGESVLIPIAIESPLTRTRYPERGEILAVLDTGYTGFALVPEEVYRALDLHLIEPVRSRARTADGRRIELSGTYAVVSVPDIGLRGEGLVETAPGMEEILLGMEWLRRVHMVMDGCSDVVLLDRCL